MSKPADTFTLTMTFRAGTRSGLVTLGSGEVIDKGLLILTLKENGFHIEGPDEFGIIRASKTMSMVLPEEWDYQHDAPLTPFTQS